MKKLLALILGVLFTCCLFASCEISFDLNFPDLGNQEQEGGSENEGNEGGSENEGDEGGSENEGNNDLYGEDGWTDFY